MGGNFWAVEFLLHAAGGSFFERGLHIERPTPVSPAGSVGSRQSDTGARPPLPLLQYVREVGLPQREGEIILYISFQRGAMVASGDRPSPTEAAAETKLPL